MAKKRKFSCILYAHSQFLCSLARFDLANRVCATQSSCTLSMIVIDETLVQPHFAVVNCSDSVMSVVYSPVLTHSLTFLQL